MPWFLPDLSMNIIGFVPFGLLMTLLVYRRGEHRAIHAWARVILPGAFLSLAIELTQIFLPDRSSSLLDLFCNGLGTSAGLVIGLHLERTGRITLERQSSGQSEQR